VCYIDLLNKRKIDHGSMGLFEFLQLKKKNVIFDARKISARILYK